MGDGRGVRVQMQTAIYRTQRMIARQMTQSTVSGDCTDVSLFSAPVAVCIRRSVKQSGLSACSGACRTQVAHHVLGIWCRWSLTQAFSNQTAKIQPNRQQTVSAWTLISALVPEFVITTSAVGCLEILSFCFYF